jgi:hypothetical protein
MLIGTRLLIVANYNSDTAVTMIRVGGSLDTVLGSVVPLLPVLLPSLTLALLVFRERYAAIVAAVCSLLVAIVSPDYRSWSGIPERATDRFLWVFLWFARVVPDWASRWLYGLNDKLQPHLPKGFREHLSSTALQGHHRARSLSQLLSVEPLFVTILIVAFILVIAEVSIDVVKGEIRLPDGSVYRQGGWFENKFLNLGLKLARIPRAIGAVVIVGIAFSLAASIYPIPPSDSGIWMQSLRRVWQPPERLSFGSGRQQVAYPLGIKDGWQVLLVERDRSILYVKPAEITARAVCDLGFHKRGSPFWGSSDVRPTSYPSCFPRSASEGKGKLVGKPTNDSDATTASTVPAIPVPQPTPVKTAIEHTVTSPFP